MQNFGKRLKVLRIENGYSSQESFAKIFSISRSTYSKWECGHAEPNFSDLVRLSKFYNVSIDFLLGVDVCPPEDESILLNYFRNLNKEGKAQLLHHADLLDKSGLYKKYFESKPFQKTV